MAHHPLRERPQSWIDFWDGQTTFSERLLRKNAETFLELAETVLDIRSEDVVLDIGCGPGLLPRAIKGRVAEVHCLDTSPAYVNLCREEFKGSNVRIHALDRDRYTDLSSLEPKRFSLIVCAGVVGYYRSQAEVKDLLSSVRRVAQPGGRLLVSDIPSRGGLVSDVVSQLADGIRGGYFAEVLRVLFRTRFSDYYTTLKEHGLLRLEPDDLLAILDGLQLDGEVLDCRLTSNATRLNLLVRF